MIRSLAFASLLAIASLSFAQNATEHSYTISGSQPWTDTHLAVAAGDSLTFTAEATPGSDKACTPQGVASGSSANLPVPSASGGALIAKTSESGNAVLVGNSGSLRAETAGGLFLGINGTPQPNCTFTVKVSVAQSAAAPAVSMKQKLSSAAQVFMKGQFGGATSAAQSQSSNAINENSAATAATTGTASAGLKLPSVVLDSDLRQHIDSLPRRVDDHAGNLGDMVNFVLIGSQDRVQAVLAAADWHVADVDNKEAGLKAILNTYQKKDYLEMPMSHLYLWDRMQDFGYEQAQAFSVVASRHHFRLWKAPFTYKNETVWVGAATHDTGFEKDIRTGKLTHKIDPNVDDERENLASGLQKSGKTKSMTYYLPPDPVQEAKNASGGSYHSDGRLLVVFVQ